MLAPKEADMASKKKSLYERAEERGACDDGLDDLAAAWGAAAHQPIDDAQVAWAVAMAFGDTKLRPWAGWAVGRLATPEQMGVVAGADLRRAKLRCADLAGADLRGADLRGANLASADLAGADLTGADLTGAKLWGAALSGADLRGAIGWRA